MSSSRSKILRGLNRRGARGAHGATMVEYALALSLLFVVFMIAGRLLQERSDARFQNSTQVVTGMAPCGGSGGGLSADECL